MKESGYSGSDRAEAMKEHHARKQGHRGMSRTAESAAVSIQAAELAFHGRTYNEIADILCSRHNRSYQHKDLMVEDTVDKRHFRDKANKCGESFRKRVDPIKQYFRDYDWEFTGPASTFVRK